MYHRTVSRSKETNSFSTRLSSVDLARPIIVYHSDCAATEGIPKNSKVLPIAWDGGVPLDAYKLP